jgi:histidine phosphotransferase ChpT
MTDQGTPDLAALVGSRICHDLISPVGAIANGLELLQMSGAATGPEVTLIGDSVSSANARIRFFRVAFGQGGAGQAIAAAEVRDILGDLYRGGRLTVQAELGGDAARDEVKLVFLLLLCLETSLPYGGRIAIRRDGRGWSLEAESDKYRTDEALWALLGGARVPPTLTPAQVHYALAPVAAAHLGRTIRTRIEPDRIGLAV